MHLKEIFSFLPSVYSVWGLIFWSLLSYILALVLPAILTPIIADINKDIEYRNRTRLRRKKERYEKIGKALGYIKPKND